MWPEEIRPWIQRAQAVEPFTVEQKREALSASYDELAKGADSTLPKPFKGAYRKSKAGFTDDVMDRTLLEGPPEGIAD